MPKERLLTCWSQLAIQSVVCLAAVNSQWLQLLLGGLKGKPFFAVPTGELAEAFFCITPLDECTYNVFAVGELPLASLRLFRLRAPFHGCPSGPAQKVLLLGGRKAHELHWPAQIDPPHPPVLEHQGSLWPRTQSILQRPIPAPWSAREAAPRNRLRYTGLVANLTLVSATLCSGCRLQIVWCIAPYRQEVLEGDILQLTRDLLPALCALCPICLRPDLLGVFATSQLSHVSVPPCCALVDWPVGTPFTVHAYTDHRAVMAAHPSLGSGWPAWNLTLLNPSDLHDQPCSVLASCSWPVAILMVIFVQAMRERSGHLETRSFVLADAQDRIADPGMSVRRAFSPEAHILMKMQ